MKALVKQSPERGIWMTDVPEPEIGPNDVLVKIKKTAICGTDIHIYLWDAWAQKTIHTPLTIGHEFAGEIVGMGQEVQGFKIGDRVSGEGHIACGFCRNCRAGRRHLCRVNISVGVTRTGCFAEYLAIPAANAYPLPENISDEQASILDPFGNAAHTALSYDLVGEDVLITGAGPVGIMATAVARHAGARYIVITDVNEFRLELAKKMGASLALNIQRTSLTEAMNTLHMREGFDVGLEMSGNPHAFNDMLAHMNHAGKVALLGFLPNDTQIDWNQIIMKGLQIKGIYGREMFETWYKMISMLQSGLNISPIITHQFSIDEYQTAFEVMASGKSGKVIMNWT
ncbi:L-threonine 3-dehydrogenase [Gammaproteobacteria bacterium SCGC AG-212-F23]|nr:L-threonine 3-dehydrogenase [Gammaproteobacteria bacterium SCGC AG-212-F23]